MLSLKLHSCLAEMYSGPNDCAVRAARLFESINIDDGKSNDSATN